MTLEIEQHENRCRRCRYGTAYGHHLQKQSPFGNPGTTSPEKDGQDHESVIEPVRKRHQQIQQEQESAGRSSGCNCQEHLIRIVDRQYGRPVQLDSLGLPVSA